MHSLNTYLSYLCIYSCIYRKIHVFIVLIHLCVYCFFSGVFPSETTKQLHFLGVFSSKAGTSDSTTKTCEEQDLSASTYRPRATLASVTFLLSWKSKGTPPMPTPTIQEEKSSTFGLSKSQFFKNVIFSGEFSGFTLTQYQ